MRIAVQTTAVLLACLAVAGCEEGGGFALSGASSAVDDYPVRKASCVDAVRRATRSVDVRAEGATVVDGGTPEASTVVFGLTVGADGAPWTCTADNAGAVSDVAPVAILEPVAQPAAEAE